LDVKRQAQEALKCSEALLGPCQRLLSVFYVKYHLSAILAAALTTSAKVIEKGKLVAIGLRAAPFAFTVKLCDP
jgi:hypothetical protein